MFISYPILTALVGLIFAQLAKIPIHFLFYKEFDWRLMFSTGGMPSSHTSTIVALTTAIGITTGVYSNEFAISLVISSIVMHDALGVRRQAGYHAKALNKLIVDFNELVKTLKNPKVGEEESKKKLKELLGHEPLEVFFGAITGILVGIIVYQIYPF